MSNGGNLTGDEAAAVATAAFQADVERLVADVERLVRILDEEGEAARRGGSAELKACYARKMELTRSLEEHHEGLQRKMEAAGGPPVASEVQRQQLKASDAALKEGLARNERALRGASEGVRRIFEGAARTLAAEDIGYGPGLLTGEAGIFDSRSV